MKNLIFLLTFSLTILKFNAQAQDSMIFLPPAIEWNLHRGGRVSTDLLLKNPTELDRIKADKYWVEPSQNKKSLYMYVTSPKEQGFKKEYRHTEFIYKILEMGYSPCPIWLPIQAYLRISDQETPLMMYVPIEDTFLIKNEIYFFAVGPNGKKSHDLFLRRLTKGDYRAKWVFVKYEEP